MLGDDQDGEIAANIADDVALYFDSDQLIDPTELRGILTQPAVPVWSGASVVPNESTDLIWPRMTGTEPGACRFAAKPEAIEAGLCKPAFPHRSPAIVEGASLAYLTLRAPEPEATERRWELGAIGHGTTGAQLAQRVCEHIRDWDRDRTAQPVVTAYPAHTPDWELAHGMVINKRFIRLVISV